MHVDRRRRRAAAAPTAAAARLLGIRLFRERELRIVRLVEFQGLPSQRGERLPALKSTTLIAKAKRIPLVFACNA